MQDNHDMQDNHENEKASKAKTDRYADDAMHIMVKRVGETEFRPISDLAAEDRELAEAMQSDTMQSDTMQSDTMQSNGTSAPSANGEMHE